MGTSTSHKGVLKDFEPIMQDGVQRSWQSTGGNTYYTFKATFERTDGTEPKIDVGEMNSSSTTPKWKKGDNYSYDRVVQGDQGQYIKFSNHKSLDQPSGGYKGGGSGRKMSKEDRDRIIRAVALEVAHNAIIDLGKADVVTDFNMVTAVANYIFWFVNSYSKDVKEKEMMLENASRRGVDGIQFKNLKTPLGPVINKETLVEYAKLCFAYIWAGTNKDNILTPIDNL